MGFQFNQDDNYDPAFDEDRGNVTLVDDDSPGAVYNDDCN
jgi:hypothetical protein